MPLSVFNARVLCVRPIGVTSDYCPVCRQERRFHLCQAERKRYLLCFDQGREGHPHHELTCFVCGCKCERPAEERPIEILPDPKNGEFNGHKSRWTSQRQKRKKARRKQIGRKFSPSSEHHFFSFSFFGLKEKQMSPLCRDKNA